MREFSRSCLTIAFSLISLTATAQEQATINKNDLPDPRTSVDQNPVNTGDVSMQMQGGMPGRTRISNAASAATDSSTAARTLSSANKDVMQQQTVTGNVKPRPLVTNEFQRFVAESTGKFIPLFGAEFFENTPSTFAPIANTPVPTEYPLGPGDELLIRGWGTIDIDFRATLDRNGMITVPQIGGISLNGVKAGEAESIIRAAVAKLFKGVSLNVSFGQLRAITVYVVGQANRPGTYTVSNLSTLVTTLFASGGPNVNGSMRRIQVKRSGKVVAELDLYAFIAKGDKSADIKLQDGDSIYIPAAKGFVAVVGKVNSPAIYELRSAEDTVASMLDFAGGLPVVADPRRAFLEHITPNINQPRTVEQFALDATGVKRALKNGDVLNIASVAPEFSNAVILRGNVDQPIRAPFKAGMHISDLIPSRDYLMNRASIQRQNDSIFSTDADNDQRRPGNDPNYSSNDNTYPNNGNYEANARTNRGGNNNANRNSAYNDNGKLKASSLVASVGGLITPINWDYAVVERVNRVDQSVRLIPFNLGKVFQNKDGPDNIALQAGDIVTIFSEQDIVVPIDKRHIFVRIEGEVNAPGIYQMTPGENLQGLLARAGGPTSNAYLFGTEFYRERVRLEQTANLAKVVNRLETQLQSEQTKVAANNTTADAQLNESRRQMALKSAEDAINRIRQLRPNGRITFNLNPQDRSFNHLPQIKLENGDRLVIPSTPDFVHVYGSVNTEASSLWRQGATVKKYLKNAGLTTDADADNVFLLRVDGSVVAPDHGSWLSSGIDDVEVMPGDSIVVPEKLDKETSYTKFMVGLKDWTQILANVGLGAAAIRVLQ